MLSVFLKHDPSIADFNKFLFPFFNTIQVCLSSLYLAYLEGSREIWENHADALSAALFSSFPAGPVYSSYHAPQHCEENRKSKTNLVLNIPGRQLVYSWVYSLLTNK